MFWNWVSVIVNLFSEKVSGVEYFSSGAMYLKKVIKDILNFTIDSE